jgi:hypothetical protein
MVIGPAIEEARGGPLPFLQMTINVAHRRSSLSHDPSEVSKVTTMAVAVRAQIEAEAQRAAKVAVVTTEKLESSVEKYNMVMVDKKQVIAA